jgi:two-component system response regulator PilR (NtrC family)
MLAAALTSSLTALTELGERFGIIVVARDRDSMEQILIVDDEQSMLEVLDYMLRREGYGTTLTLDPRHALALITGESGFDLVISDLRMPEMDGIELLRQARKHDPELPFIFITAHASSETAIEALKLGAFDYITKPFQIEEFKNLVGNALVTRSLKRKVRLLESERFSSEDLVGISPPMLEIYKLIGTVATTDSTILILGESGTGKELVARAVHRASARRDRAFVSINCGAFPETLLESELFGYMRGAFTGAVGSKKGLFEAADSGTLFLDEVGEMSPAMQVKLLRALQDKRVRRVGGTDEIFVDTRVIAATNRDLLKEVEAGCFREDLYYRLAVIPISIPPLRERKSDILALVRHFIRRFNHRLDRKIAGVAEEALACLEDYHWPGNVRELENVLERAVTLETTDVIQPERLPEHVRRPGRDMRLVPAAPQFGAAEGFDLERHLRDVERQIIERALALCDGNQTRAAEILKLTYRSLRHRMETLGMRKVGGEAKPE